MDAKTISQWRWFWPWQDDVEEAWLASLSRERGWHLQSLELPGRYAFAVGQPRDYVYRLDYRPMRGGEKDGYLQLFADLGWDYIGRMGDWRYFRKLAAPGEQPEIFTDSSSKIGKYRRFLRFGVFELILLGVLIGSGLGGRYWGGASEVIRLLLFLVFVLWMVVVIRVWRRTEQLKRT
jgi:hypothetical protein